MVVFLQRVSNAVSRFSRQMPTVPVETMTRLGDFAFSLFDLDSRTRNLG